MPGDPESTYRSKADSFKTEIRRAGKRNIWYSAIRLFLFVLAIFLLVRLYSVNLAVAVASSLLALVILLVFVKLGSIQSSRRLMLEELVRINEEETAVLNWVFDCYHPGTEYIDPGHPYTSDLDIYGKNSLFQYLNRASTSSGRDQLAGWLNRTSPGFEITRRQASAEELSRMLDWRQEFLATGRMSEETPEDQALLLNWLKEASFIATSKWFRLLLIILPSLTLLSTVLAFFWIPYNIPVFLVLVQLGMVGVNLRRINHHHNQLSRKFNLINKFSRLITMIEKETFKSAYLQELRDGLSTSGIKAGEQLHALSRLLVQFDRRLNMVMGLILNALVMWDLQCVLRLERWKIANAGEVPNWFKTLGKFEALNSFAAFKYNLPDTAFPEISRDGVILEAESLGHPLIPAGENIRNNISIGRMGTFMLITGSNMAGKSTFLRTIGVNMILANAGAPVLAGKMIWEPVSLLTSMRVRDSLSSRESTFYAELKRLRMIIEVLKSGEQVLVILDEILKGTNSRDKHFGSEMFIRQMIREGCTGLIATHDLELSKLEEEFPDNLTNYCFEVQIDREEFIFDYKLRRGVCQTLNATELMKKMGITIDSKT